MKKWKGKMGWKKKKLWIKVQRVKLHVVNEVPSNITLLLRRAPDTYRLFLFLYFVLHFTPSLSFSIFFIPETILKIFFSSSWITVWILLAANSVVHHLIFVLLTSFFVFSFFFFFFFLFFRYLSFSFYF